MKTSKKLFILLLLIGATLLVYVVRTKIKEAKGLVGQGTLESLKKLADEMLEYRLNDKDYFKKSLEFEIELIEKHPERFENPQLELLLLKSSLIRIKNEKRKKRKVND